jgi:hypothetical protein
VFEKTVDRLEFEVTLADHDNFDNVLAESVAESRKAQDQARAQSPAGRLAWLTAALRELQLDDGCLAGARKLVEADHLLGSRQFERTQQAVAAREAALARLVEGSDREPGRGGGGVCRGGAVAGQSAGCV